MSIRNLNEAASPPDLEDEDTVVDDGMEIESTLVEVNMDSIPNFAEQGITNHTEILLE